MYKAKYKKINVAVIGNGFDIKHNLNSKLEQFIQFYEYPNGGFYKHLSDFDYDDYIDDVNGICKSIDDIVKNNLWIKLSLYIKQYDIPYVNWCDIEELIGNVMVTLSKAYQSRITNEVIKYNQIQSIIINFTKNNGLSINRVEYINQAIEKYASDLKELIFLLNKYLTYIVNTTTTIKDQLFYDLFKTGFYKMVISYNYTNLFNDLYNNDNDINLVKLHGSLDDYISMVFGTDFELNKGIDDDDRKYMDFQKYYQRIVKSSDFKYREIIYKHKIEVLFFYGFSFGISDRDTISFLFDNANKIFINYYNDADRASIVANLSNIFGKEKLTTIANEKIKFISNDFEDMISCLRENEISNGLDGI